MFTKTELEMMYAMLEQFSEELSYQSCTDYPIANTPENIRFCIQMDLYEGNIENEEEFNRGDSDGKLWPSSSSIADYLKHLVKLQLNKTAQNE